jgi:DNA-binding GntR family transcriptional regulator
MPAAKPRRTRKISKTAERATRRPAEWGVVSLSEQAYRAIREKILRGELGLGAPLSRRKIAAELGMSLLPVSEALNRLVDAGLVESRARVGTRVCCPTPDEIREHYQVREALDTQAARLFAEKASARERVELRAMAEEIDDLFNRCSAGENDSEFLYTLRSYHLRFHLRIAECTGCRALRQMLERNHVLVFTWLFDIAAKRPPLPARHHRDLMHVVSTGTPEEADRAMRQHVREGLESIIRALDAARPASSRVKRAR